jgi:hypothetical protein
MNVNKNIPFLLNQDGETYNFNRKLTNVDLGLGPTDNIGDQHYNAYLFYDEEDSKLANEFKWEPKLIEANKLKYGSLLNNSIESDTKQCQELMRTARQTKHPTNNPFGYDSHPTSLKYVHSPSCTILDNDEVLKDKHNLWMKSRNIRVLEANSNCKSCGIWIDPKNQSHIYEIGKAATEAKKCINIKRDEIKQALLLQQQKDGTIEREIEKKIREIKSLLVRDKRFIYEIIITFKRNLAILNEFLNVGPPAVAVGSAAIDDASVGAAIDAASAEEVTVVVNPPKVISCILPKYKEEASKTLNRLRIEDLHDMVDSLNKTLRQIRTIIKEAEAQEKYKTFNFSSYFNDLIPGEEFTLETLISETKDDLCVNDYVQKFKNVEKLFQRLNLKTKKEFDEEETLKKQLNCAAQAVGAAQPKAKTLGEVVTLIKTGMSLNDLKTSLILLKDLKKEEIKANKKKYEELMKEISELKKLKKGKEPIQDRKIDFIKRLKIKFNPKEEVEPTLDELTAIVELYFNKINNNTHRLFGTRKSIRKGIRKSRKGTRKSCLKYRNF